MAINVKVSTAQLQDGARRYEESRRNCENIVKQMMAIADSLKGSWKGEAANNFYNKLQQIQGDLGDMNRIIDEQTKDLQAMEKVYVKAEDAAAQKATALETDVLSF